MPRAPRGTKAGATALVQSCEAYSKGISIEKYAKTHKEFAEAIKFFSKKERGWEEAEKSSEETCEESGKSSQEGEEAREEIQKTDPEGQKAQEKMIFYFLIYSHLFSGNLPLYFLDYLVS